MYNHFGYSVGYILSTKTPRLVSGARCNGSPTRARTWNLLINSQSLYH